MYYEGSRDFYSVFIAMFFTDENECLKKAKEVMLPKYFPVYEKILKNCNTKYLVGDVISFADVGLLECLLAVEEFLGMESIDSYPKIKEYYQKMKAEDRISTFLKGPHRKKRNDEEYVATEENGTVDTEDLSNILDSLKRKQEILRKLDDDILQELDDGDIETEIVEADEYAFNLEGKIGQVNKLILVKTTSLSTHAESFTPRLETTQPDTEHQNNSNYRSSDFRPSFS
ncbi:GST [Mytilus coruscus]|uniref:GST n=1 Tax=Mytilus coruscus TaxID=42192 RepID=A0A6J8EXN5_MYTCO|nr:GST [Mytilus coruscus]